MYPSKTRTQIVADLLTSALKDIDRGMPIHEGRVIGRHPELDEDICEEWGPRIEFHALANKDFDEIERELGNEAPKPLY